MLRISTSDPVQRGSSRPESGAAQFWEPLQPQGLVGTGQRDAAVRAPYLALLPLPSGWRRLIGDQLAAG